MRTLITTGLLLFGLAACSGPHASGSYQSHAGYDRLYAASLGAVSAIGYSVTTASKADGLIVAHQGVVLGEGSTVGLNANVAREGSASTLHVDIVAPPATLALGGLDGTMAEYISAVRARVPDIRPAAQ
jgi:hypothetical protein